MKAKSLILAALLLPLVLNATPAEDTLRDRFWSKCNSEASALPFSFTLDGKPSAEVLKTWNLERSERKLDESRSELVLT